MHTMKPTTKDIIRFVVYAIALIAFTVWVGQYLLLLGLPILFDMYISKKVKWDFYKKPKNGKKPHWLIEWLDAIIFALVAVGIINIYFFQNYKIPTSSLEKSLLVGDYLFVSKMAYGPRNPITPLSFPLAQNQILGVKSYFEKPQWDYKRLKGFGHVKHDDIVVFNYPAGDTVATKMPNPDYYQWCRMAGRERVIKNQVYGVDGTHYDMGEIVYRPVDRRDNYVKRCVALPGDSLKIDSGQVYINNVPQKNIKGLQWHYEVYTKNNANLSNRVFEELKLSSDDHNKTEYGYGVYLTSETAEKLSSLPVVQWVKKDMHFRGQREPNIFPNSNSAQYKWNGDFYGPLWIPKKGATVALTLENLCLYDRIIKAYEGNELAVRDSAIYINGEKTTEYTFKMDYYFMMGDNRHNSLDSRYWGFVPEDHIVGKPILVWLSLDKDKSFPANIRWNRIFKVVSKTQD